MAVVEKGAQPYISVEGGLAGEDPREKFRYLNILVHSPGGHGKTTLIKSATEDPRLYPILVLDDEGGAPLRFADADPSRFTLRKIRTLDDVNTIYEYLAKGNHPYKSVAIDSLTDLQKVGLTEFVYGSAGMVPKNFKGTVVDVKQAEIQHWGKSHTQMTMLVRYFRDLPMHVIFTTLSVTDKDEITGKISTNISLPGKQQADIPGVPDIVGYLDIQKIEGKQVRILKVQPDGKICAKDRTDALGDGIIIEQHGGLTKMLDLIWKKYNIADKESTPK